MKENKGSILIALLPMLAILFIGIGISVYNSSNGVLERAEEANREFESYSNNYGNYYNNDYDYDDYNYDDYDYDDDYDDFENMYDY